ncbi:hypothetical protein PTSG_09404 [Salpingoeca rosetta]|uniref:Uncharacterized protein n=1 Tax=Salpingoeca rosetta (strain ATCC 50818 / BSB-021) TaxID=946362 RepID=F2UMI9_SALR5|nr:uncharacterized protein PTSG_09404 [Salpingoeca rosetta]EGD78338.1 hypothetical protein PTSG_09404 [Salpingoeca rosetta]|eukprot:XP_004989661.1 hypothetical protein PTSG_09404 [Salpingoeca rosetta]
MAVFGLSLVEAGLTVGPLLGGFASAFHTRGETKTWYKTIQLPWFTPPSWVFPPVWSSLYLGMGYASCLVLKESEGDFARHSLAWGLYASQLALNLSWSTIFFKKHQIAYGLANVCVQLPLAAWCALEFRRIVPKTALFMSPLIAWLSVAAIINYEVWRLNPNRRYGEPPANKSA